ncbi:MAG: CHAP domain-containing protein [bacterium]|nr:CHAP domain-containing protein [bacterium]
MNTRSRRTLSALAASATLVAGILTVAPAPGQAQEATDECAALISGVDKNLVTLRSQVGELNGQISEVDAEVSKLKAEYAELEKEAEGLWKAILEGMKEGYVVDSSSTPFDALVSSKRLSVFFSSEHYRNKINDDLQEKVEAYLDTLETLDEKLAEAKEKRDGLLTLQGQRQERLDTAEDQEAAKRAVEQLDKEQCEQAREANERDAAAGIVQATGGNSASASSGGGGGSPQPVFGGHGGNPYPWGQCTWYVYSQTGRGQNGNAGTWGAGSSTPGVGKIMIWSPGEQGAGGAGHVGLVIGVSGNNVTIRHMNWNGPGVVSTGTFRSTGKFY